MQRKALVRAAVAAIGAAALVSVSGAVAATGVTVGANVNAGAEAFDQAETGIAINPTNPQNVVVFANDALGNTARYYTFDGGSSWTRGTVNTGLACCDGQAAFDSFGNLFLVYLSADTTQVHLVVSTDGGATFTSPTILASTGDVDQPSIAVGDGSVWVDWNQDGVIAARGAAVTGLGSIGAFGPQQGIPNACVIVNFPPNAPCYGSFGGIAVGPAGQVTVTYQNPYDDQGPATISTSTDSNGLSPGGFAKPVVVTQTNVGGFDFIPAQPDRSIDAEANLAYDRSGGPHNGRLYMAYTDETPNESNNTDIYVRTSNNNGATWSAPVKVNDDQTTTSQFMPAISVDQTTGNVAVTWYDSRNDCGSACLGHGSTDSTANNDAMYYGAVSFDGGATFGANFQISDGVSNVADSGGGVDYGDYVSNDFNNGLLYPAWSDNSNSTGDNPDGTLRYLDIYTAKITVVTPDLTPPTTTITLSPSSPNGNNGWYKGPVTVAVGATDDSSGVAETRCVLDPASAPTSFADLASGCGYTGSGANVSSDGPHTVYAASKDNGGNAEKPVSSSFKIDETAPTVTCPASPSFTFGSAGNQVTATVSDAGSLPLQASVSAAAPATTVGMHSITVTGEDNAGNTTTVSCSYSVVYNFTGFFQPVDNLPTLNSVKAGQAIPVKFSLADNQGLNVLASGSPQSQPIGCSSTAPVDAIEQTTNAGNSSLSYDTTTNTYTYTWKTDKAWANTCRQLILTLNDGTIERANFTFTK